MNPLRTVLVDDEPLARERLERLLKEGGCSVEAALPDGPSLIQWRASNPPVDARFVDIQMPGPNGLEVLAELRDPPPVVFVTAYQADEIWRLKAYQRGAADFMFTPVIPQILRAKAPKASARLTAELVAFVQRLRKLDLFKSPGVAEAIDWASALTELDAVALDPAQVSDTLGVLLKYQDDIGKVQGSEAARLLAQMRSEAAGPR